MRDRVAIVGSHHGTRSLAPWDCPDTDLWLFNEAAASNWIAGRVDGVFQLHAPAVYRNPENKSDREHWAWLQQPHPFPVWMQELDPLVPSSVRYPLDQITASFLPHFTWPDGGGIEFYTNSISYAIALALYRGYKFIDLYGVEMSSNTEYHYQRVNVAFWIGYALGEGVQVVMHCAHNIFDVPRYGYDGAVTLGALDFERGMADMERNARERRDNASMMSKAAQYALAQELDFEQAHQRLLDALIEQGRAEGILSEAQRYVDKTRLMVAANGAAPLFRQEFEICAAQAESDRERYKAMMNFDSGRALVMLELWKATQDAQYLTAFKKYSDAQLGLALSAGNADGRRIANSAYLQETDELIRAAGGSKALEALGG